MNLVKTSNNLDKNPNNLDKIPINLAKIFNNLDSFPINLDILVNSIHFDFPKLTFFTSYVYSKQFLVMTVCKNN